MDKLSVSSNMVSVMGILSGMWLYLKSKPHRPEPHVMQYQKRYVLEDNQPSKGCTHTTMASSTTSALTW